jgi:hypothetical protein
LREHRGRLRPAELKPSIASIVSREGSLKQSCRS